MGLLKTVVDIKDVSASALVGYPTWPIAALPFESDLASVYPSNMLSYVSPGRGALTASPIQSADACNMSRRWVAQNLGASLVQDSGVLGNLPRWSFNGSGLGLLGTLDAALTDYSIAMLVRTPTVTGLKPLLTIGASSSTRTMLYITGPNVALQHGTGDVKTTTGTAVVANTWLPVVVSYKNSDKAIRVYTASTTALISSTMTNSPPSDFVGAWGSSNTGSLYFTGEIALGILWDTPLHSDVTALGKVIAAINGIKAL